MTAIKALAAIVVELSGAGAGNRAAAAAAQRQIQELAARQPPPPLTPGLLGGTVCEALLRAMDDYTSDEPVRCLGSRLTTRGCWGLSFHACTFTRSAADS